MRLRLAKLLAIEVLLPRICLAICANLFVRGAVEKLSAAVYRNSHQQTRIT